METGDRCSIFSDEWIDYVIGECSETDKKTMESHLSSCPICRQEVNELREAWALIPFQMPYQAENVEVPGDLKAEVMSAIFEPATMNEPRAVKPWHVRRGRRFATWLSLSNRWVTAGLTMALICVAWNNLSLRQQLTAQSNSPAQVVQTYALQAPPNAISLSKGNAWIYEQGSKKTLVLHLQGLATTQGTEAYQVWLIHEGKRRSAGVFRVDSQGTGVLAYDMQDPSLPFEAIGITLEPDENGMQPRGKKVLGT